MDYTNINMSCPKDSYPLPNKIFEDEIENMMKIYMEDMIAKFRKENMHKL